MGMSFKSNETWHFVTMLQRAHYYKEHSLKLFSAAHYNEGPFLLPNEK